MTLSARDAYLDTRVSTATPQRLRLMLIEAALREAEQTARHWDEQQPEPALETLIRCRGLISELIAGIRPDASPLAQKVLGLYVFLFQVVTEAQLSRDRQKLAIVRRVLASERETWQQVFSDAALAMDTLVDETHATRGREVKILTIDANDLEQAALALDESFDQILASPCRTGAQMSHFSTGGFHAA